MKLPIVALIFAVCVFAQAAPHSNVFTWGWAQGANTDPPSGFHIWRSSGTGGTCATMGAVPYATILGTATLTYTDTAVSGGQSWCYQVTAFASTTDSSPTNEVSCATPFLLTSPTDLQGKAN